jgi:hypothetical protein
VIQSISKVTGVTMQQIEEQRLKKRETKGGFDRKIYNHCIDIEENNQEIVYYLIELLSPKGKRFLLLSSLLEGNSTGF